jgi:DnaJ like chaperone protein
MWKFVFIILAVLYTLNPYDIFPDLMIGWGWLDDLVIWGLLWRYFASQKKKYTPYQRFYQHADRSFKNESESNASGQNDRHSGHADFHTKDAWDPYQVLGIDRRASAAEIKQSYRKLASKYHPDKLEHLGDEFKELAERRFKEIQKAYQELTGKGA